jgi:hypothetical protein
MAKREEERKEPIYICIKHLKLTITPYENFSFQFQFFFLLEAFYSNNLFIQPSIQSEPVSPMAFRDAPRERRKMVGGARSEDGKTKEKQSSG